MLKEFNENQEDLVIDLINAVIKLEKNGKRFLIEYGYNNAIDMARNLKEEFPDQPSWDEIFMREVYLWATKSKDPRTKIGAVLAKDNIPLSHGYNGFPRRVDDTKSRYENREQKYQMVVHAEDNSVLNCSRRGISSIGSILYTQGYPCNECAKSIIQGGVKEVVLHSQWTGITKKWTECAKISKTMFYESGVNVRYLNKVLGVKGYNDGKIIDV